MSTAAHKLAVVSAPKGGRATRPRAKHTTRYKVGLAVGGVGVGVLTLSVYHCTVAITALTGSHWTLASLLAIGVDAGMVSCELATIVAPSDKRVQVWATAYVGVSVVLSMLLNAYSFAQHCASGMQWAGVTLGVTIPALVFVLGRVAGLLSDTK